MDNLTKKHLWKTAPLLVFLASVGLHAQEYRIKNDPQTPVQILELRSMPGSTSYQLILRNDTDSQILALVIHTNLTLTDGKKATSHTVEDYNGLGLAAATLPLPPARSTFSPRMGFSFQPPPGTQLAHAEMQVVYVEMVDGRIFGSEGSKFKSLLDTQRAARRTERTRLRSVSQKNGIDAVLEDLSQGESTPSSPGIDTPLLVEWRKATSGERKRLRHVLQRGGSTALIAEINKN